MWRKKGPVQRDHRLGEEWKKGVQRWQDLLRLPGNFCKEDAVIRCGGLGGPETNYLKYQELKTS